MYSPIKEHAFNHLVMTLGNWHIMKYCFEFIFKNCPIFKELLFSIFNVDQLYHVKVKSLIQFFTILDIAAHSIQDKIEELDNIITLSPIVTDLKIQTKCFKVIFFSIIPMVSTCYYINMLD